MNILAIRGTRIATFMLLANLFLLVWDYDRLQYVLPFRPTPKHHVDKASKFPTWFFVFVFATLVSEMLRLPVYDTQCGAKLFRSTPELRRILAEPFGTAWLFDVEILARLIGQSPGGTAAVERYLYELPLDEWRDVPGSKLTRAAYVRAATSIFQLYRRYGAMLARQSRASDAVDVQLPA